MQEIEETRLLQKLFFAARTHNTWLPQPVSDALLVELYEMLRWAPTSANCNPARFVFVKGDEAKARLLPALMEGNVEKTRMAPVTAIIGYDLDFAEQLPRLFPHADARSWFAGNPQLTQETAFRNGSLQGAYLILAARALGLDCGPMSGFDAAKVQAEFFPEGNVVVNFLCNLGYGDPNGVFPRGPRFDFDEVCRVV